MATERKYRSTLLQRWDMHAGFSTYSIYGTKGVGWWEYLAQQNKMYSPVSGYNMLSNAQKTNWESFNSAIRDNPEDITLQALGTI